MPTAFFLTVNSVYCVYLEKSLKNTNDRRDIVASRRSRKWSRVNVTSIFYMFDNVSGNLIQMTAEKMVSGQPPPLVITGSTSAKSKLK